MAETEAEPGEATTVNGPNVRIELGGLVISVENAPDLDTGARVALGLLRKVEPLAKRGVVGFYSGGAAQTEVRPQPDLSWRGMTWGDGDD
jgi:hypothetical protein